MTIWSNSVELSRPPITTIAGLQPPKRPVEHEPVRMLAGTIEQKLSPMQVKAEGRAIRLAVTLEFPPGYKVNPLAPLAYQVDRLAGGSPASASLVRQAALGKPTAVKPPAAAFEIVLPTDAATGRDTLRVTVNYYYCRDGADGICKAGSAAWVIPVEASADAANSTVPLRHRAR